MNWLRMAFVATVALAGAQAVDAAGTTEERGPGAATYSAGFLPPESLVRSAVL